MKQLRTRVLERVPSGLGYLTDAEIEVPYPFFLVTAGQDADYLDLGLRLPLPDGGKQETNAFHDLVVIVDSDVIRADH